MVTVALMYTLGLTCSCLCRNPSLGLATKAKGLQGCDQKEVWELSQEQARESRQEKARESHHTPGSVRKCEGVSLHTPKATPTLGDGVPVDSRNFREQLQVSNLNVLWHSLYLWKALDEVYNFASDRTSIGGLLAKLWGSKVAGVLVGRISELPLGSPGKKGHLDVGPVESHRVYYKGEGGGFPKSGP